MKAMIFACGRGERMRPEADAAPKPLMKVRGRPLIVWHILNLVRAGVTDIVINQSPPALIEPVLGDGSNFGATLRYSLEPSPLGSAGAVAHARVLLGDEPFIAVAGDVYCPHFPFATLLTALEDKDVWGNPYPPDQRDVAWVHLVKNPAELEGDFALSSFALANQGAPLHTFADIGIYRPEMFDAIKPGEAAELGQLLRSYAERGQVGGDLFRGDWLRVASGADLALLNAPYTPPSAPSGLH